MSLCQSTIVAAKCTECKLVQWDGSSWIECVVFFGVGRKRGRRRVNSSDRGRIEHVTQRKRRRQRRREKGRMDAGCSHGQAHSSCSACWDAPGSVQHNTITACSGVLCSALLCSDSVLLSFVVFAVFPLPLSPSLSLCPPRPPFFSSYHDSLQSVQ